MPVLVGFASLAAESGLWFYEHQTILSAADAGAVSAATAGGNFFAEASGVTASYGFADGVNGVTVTVNQPPQSGSFKSAPGAVEVIVQQTRPRLFSVLYSSTPATIKGRAVAVRSNAGTGCVLALNRTAGGAISTQGAAQVVLQGCSVYDNSGSVSALSLSGSATISTSFVGLVGGISGNGAITATNGIRTGVAPAIDPYAAVAPPPFFGCDQHNFTAKSIVTINPGVYCGGISLNAGANLTLNPGVYYLDKGSLSVVGGGTISGDGVTLVFTSSTGGNWATAKVASNANVNLTAPTTGPTAGIVIFGDRNMPVGTSFQFNGGAAQSFGGAIYAPQGALDFVGGSSTGGGCTQLIGDTISFSGNSSLQVNCNAAGTKAIGSATATLVE
ncbi:MAG: hypothetical protein HYS06_02730 [Methylocystis sp.]|nr:hypothetical protein [Methylocystis sp.]MBI3275133.1 hypothetical protein [Methylocystis sp.]